MITTIIIIRLSLYDLLWPVNRRLGRVRFVALLRTESCVLHQHSGHDNTLNSKEWCDEMPEFLWQVLANCAAQPERTCLESCIVYWILTAPRLILLTSRHCLNLSKQALKQRIEGEMNEVQKGNGREGVGVYIYHSKGKSFNSRSVHKVSHIAIIHNRSLAIWHCRPEKPLQKSVCCFYPSNNTYTNM